VSDRSAITVALAPPTLPPAATVKAPPRARDASPKPEGQSDPLPLRIRHTLEVAGTDAGGRVLRLFPRGVAIHLGRVLGFVAYYLAGTDRKIAKANVDVVLGDSRTPAQKARLARAGFQTFGAAVLGVLWGPRMTRETVGDHVFLSPETDAVVRQAMTAGRGVIFCGCHYGDWELVALAVGHLVMPLLNVAEPLRNHRLGELITAMRAASGHQMIPPRYAVLKLFKHLKRGGSIGMLIDVNGRRGRGGAWLDFFGLKVFNSTAVVELALRTGAALLFVHARPLPGGKTEIVVQPPVELSQTGDREADVRLTSQRCLDRAAALIAREPEHWLWTYKRWKRRPTPERGAYPFYSKYDPNT
jgi:KDO2-lipid IV(A) lauroyltransferase